ncbi:MAG: RHS repeat-associated core domain-containing protein, partial [Bacteroidales bacterium]
PYTSATENNVQLNFTYDLDGSMTYRPVNAATGWTQVWNGENRMVETWKGDDRLTFQYDYMGRRVEKKVYDGQALTTHLKFVYDGFKLVEELDALNGDVVLMRHTWQPFDVGLDVILATTDANGTAYFMHDANKNNMQVSGAAGELREPYNYTPFGQINSSFHVPKIGFSSEVLDRETAQLYYNYRYLDPKIGRWTKRDPIGENDINNLFISNKNSLIFLFDMKGLFSIYHGEKKKCPKGKIWTFRNISRVNQADGCSNPFEGILLGNFGKELSKLIPGIPPYTGNPDMPFDDVSFTGACDFHDYCYSNCAKEQSDCDKGLLSRAEGACDEKSSHKIFLSIQQKEEWLGKCKKWAKAYYIAVSKFGKEAYDARQKAACECQCPDALTQSGPVFIDENNKDYTPPFE